MADYRNFMEEAGANGKLAQEVAGDYMAGFAGLGEIVDKMDSVDAVTKELMYLSFAVAKQCDTCIAVHTNYFIKAGGKREQLGVLYGISTSMNGGPGMTYAAKVIEAFDQLSK